jgi:hypothetical protein
MSTKLAKMKAPSCDGHFRGTSISVHSDSDRPDDLKIDYVMQQDGHCVTARIRGPLILTTDETDVASLGTTGEVYLRENRAEMDRAVHIYSEGGTLHHDATVGGQTAAYDPEARAWVAALLPQLIRELGINVKPRVARLRAAGGVDAVLAEIDRIQSGGARRAYYEALLDGGKLSDAEVTRVTQQAARDLTSSGDLSAVLRKLAGGTTSPAGRAAFATALDHVASSGDRRATIEQLVHSADRDMLLVLAHAASGIASSGDRSDFLRQSAAAYLSKHDAGLRSAWFEVANTVPSSGDLSEVLQTALRFGNADAEVARQVMLSVDHVPSSGDKAEVLLAAANQRLLTTPAVREAYLAAARNVASSGDKARVLEAVAQ